MIIIGRRTPVWFRRHSEKREEKKNVNFNKYKYKTILYFIHL